MEPFSSCKITSPILDPIFTLREQPFYFVILLKGDYTISVDLTPIVVSGYTVVFTSPYQIIEIVSNCGIQTIEVLQFHGDFYCIEYHKKEVACNGVLFNNIFILPTLSITQSLFEDLQDIYEKITFLNLQLSNYNQPIIKSLLQLLLAYCSKEKLTYISKNQSYIDESQGDSDFEKVLRENFLVHKEVNFYAAFFNQSLTTFSKNIKKKYGKTPSLLIQEILVLEAKKQLHLTNLSVKEVAHNLNFNDEFYFSRFFKKAVGVSPSGFREKVGISIVAK